MPYFSTKMRHKSKNYESGLSMRWKLEELMHVYAKLGGLVLNMGENISKLEGILGGEAGFSVASSYKQAHLYL